MGSTLVIRRPECAARLPTPLWLPQLTMALGTAVLFIAFLDELVLELRRRRTTAEPAEALRNE